MMYDSLTSDKREVLSNGCTEREKSGDVLGHLHLNEVSGSPIDRHIASVGAKVIQIWLAFATSGAGNVPHPAPSWLT
jgi:hypothetical protein